MDSVQGILLIGPTGCGKTPFGSYCEQKGLYGLKCFHFDFGANLRQVDGMYPPPSFINDQEREVIRKSLCTGALLDNENFPIAQKVFTGFVNNKEMDADSIIVLNGLPRHEGQARDMDELVDIRQVFLLECNAEIVHQRIALNSGGDRDQRTDDSLSEIEKKLANYKQLTLPLVTYYHNRHVPVLTFRVDIHTKPKDIYRFMENYYCF